jgi:hypothetical protein
VVSATHAQIRAAKQSIADWSKWEGTMRKKVLLASLAVPLTLLLGAWIAYTFMPLRWYASLYGDGNVAHVAIWSKPQHSGDCTNVVETRRDLEGPGSGTYMIVSWKCAGN